MNPWIHGYRNDRLWITGFQVIRGVTKRSSLKPRDTLSCSWGFWAFLGNNFNAGSSVQRKPWLTLNENSVRGWDAGPKGYIVESNIRGRLKRSSWCLEKHLWLHRLCSHEVPQLLQEEKKELSCVHGWSTESPSGTRRKSAEWLGPVTLFTALSQLSSHGRQVSACSFLALLGYSKKLEKNSSVEKEIS